RVGRIGKAALPDRDRCGQRRRRVSQAPANARERQRENGYPYPFVPRDVFELLRRQRQSRHVKREREAARNESEDQPVQGDGGGGVSRSRQGHRWCWRHWLQTAQPPALFPGLRLGYSSLSRRSL